MKKKEEIRDADKMFPLPPMFPPYDAQGAAPYYPILTDPQGSWTGRPQAVTEEPVQDADDL